jgi:hypothetical protein
MLPPNSWVALIGELFEVAHCAATEPTTTMTMTRERRDEIINGFLRVVVFLQGLKAGGWRLERKKPQENEDKAA